MRSLQGNENEKEKENENDWIVLVLDSARLTSIATEGGRAPRVVQNRAGRGYHA
jgi:hypothetical protein